MASLSTHGCRPIFVLWALLLALLPAAAVYAQSDVLFVEGDKVGIGTNTPVARLDIRPGGNTDLELRVKSDATGSDVISVIQSANDTKLFRIYEATSGEGIFSVYAADGTENLRFTGQAGGRLGIGCAQSINADIVLLLVPAPQDPCARPR